MLVRVTTLAVPTFLFGNVPVALAVTTSPLMRPANITLVTSMVATTSPSYTLLLATKPDTVRALGVMAAVVLVWSVS